MKAGKYTIKELFNNRYLEQIIIPEIQRDYVWGAENVKGLLCGIIEDFKEFENAPLLMSLEGDKDMQEAFSIFYKKQKYASNIGFIYAYNDAQYAGKYFLIDGQQRITTLYLILLALAHRNVNISSTFQKIYTNQGVPKLDYRVREASHEFLTKFVKLRLESEKLIDDQTWYYEIYKHDKTINSIVNNFKVITDFLDKEQLSENVFFDYIQDYLEFWYFDTNVSEQGEELYIYMNARGEQMQGNENLKADLLLNYKEINDKDQWGKKWEEWQDLFWQYKSNNENADKGFNEFLTCIAGLEIYIGGEKLFYTKEEFDNDNKGKKGEVLYADLYSAIKKGGVQTIEQYINAIEYLMKNKEKFKKAYNYSNWVDKSIDLFWVILNQNTTNWFADYTDKNRGTEQNRMVYMWSILRYITTLDAHTETKEVFRMLRLFYMRYHNFDRSVAGILQNIKDIHQYGVWKFTAKDEQLKHDFLQEKIPNEVPFEELIWEIEDHPYNLDGSDVGNVNIYHLVQFDTKPTIDYFLSIRDKFYELFPLNDKDKVETKNQKKLQSLLIAYGEYWKRVTPNYYINYWFGDWRRIIRNLDGDKKAFSLFFQELIENPTITIDDLFMTKCSNNIIDFNSTDFNDQILWYACQLKENLWEQGDYIAIGIDWKEMDDKFVNSIVSFNTKGDFKGKNHRKLASMVDQNKT